MVQSLQLMQPVDKSKQNKYELHCVKNIKLAQTEIFTMKDID